MEGKNVKIINTNIIDISLNDVYIWHNSMIFLEFDSTQFVSEQSVQKSC